MVGTDDYARFKSLRITAEMSPSGFFVHPITESNAFMNWDFPRMIHSGAHLTLGTDAAASGSNLLPTCASIVQTVGAAFEGPDDVHVKGGEAICRMLTLAGAEATGRDDHSGSIEIGKKANFIRVNRDLSKGQFDGATVTGTWFEGEQIWRV